MSNDRPNVGRLLFLFPWLKVNLLIRCITAHVWHERDWPIAKVHRGRAFEIRRDLAGVPWWN